jgi:hypothetical protein
MTVIVNNTTSEKKIEEIIQKIKTQNPQKGLRKHFGALKREIDGLEYQKKIRNEWD